MCVLSKPAHMSGGGSLVIVKVCAAAAHICTVFDEFLNISRLGLLAQVLLVRRRQERVLA